MTHRIVHAGSTIEEDGACVIDLGGVSTVGASGAVLGIQSDQLNTNLVVIESGDSIDEHVNDEVDVMIVVLSGSGQITIDGTAHPVEPDTLVLVPRSARRAIRAEGRLTYLSMHSRRTGLLPARRPRRD